MYQQSLPSLCGGIQSELVTVTGLCLCIPDAGWGRVQRGALCGLFADVHEKRFQLETIDSRASTIYCKNTCSGGKGDARRVSLGNAYFNTFPPKTLTRPRGMRWTSQGNCCVEVVERVRAPTPDPPSSWAFTGSCRAWCCNSGPGHGRWAA